MSELVRDKVLFASDPGEVARCLEAKSVYDGR